MDPGSNSIVQAEQWLQWGAVLGASLGAAILDVRRGRIPNMLTLSLWLTGLAKAASVGGSAGLGGALELSVLLALPYVALYFLAGGGAGDAKLMGAIGAWLSFEEAVAVFCCVAVTGMVLALLRIAAHRERKNALSNLLASLYLLALAWSTGPRGWKLLTSNEQSPSPPRTGPVTLPYGVAIFIGVCLAAIGAGTWIG
jgi:Flp pilus assembly protein protease CpaA